MAAGTELLKSALSFLGELAGVPLATENLQAGLDARLDTDERGDTRISFALPPREKVESLARGFLDLIVRASTQNGISERPEKRSDLPNVSAITSRGHREG